MQDKVQVSTKHNRGKANHRRDIPRTGLYCCNFTYRIQGLCICRLCFNIFCFICFSHLLALDRASQYLTCSDYKTFNEYNLKMTCLYQWIDVMAQNKHKHKHILNHSSFCYQFIYFKPGDKFNFPRIQTSKRIQFLNDCILHKKKSDKFNRLFNASNHQWNIHRKHC